jgi:hypothetical protein
MVLFSQEDCCLRLRVDLKLEPPPAVHGFRHTIHVVLTDFVSSQKLRWLSRTDEI